MLYLKKNSIAIAGENCMRRGLCYTQGDGISKIFVFVSISLFCMFNFVLVSFLFLYLFLETKETDC